VSSGTLNTSQPTSKSELELEDIYWPVTDHTSNIVDLWFGESVLTWTEKIVFFSLVDVLLNLTQKLHFTTNNADVIKTFEYLRTSIKFLKYVQM